MADVKMSALPTDASVGGSEELLALDGVESVVITPAQLAAYAVDTLLAAAAATPTTGDNLVGERTGTEKLLGLDAVADYAADYVWSGADAVQTIAEAANQIVVLDGVDRKTMTMTVLTTYVLSGAVAASDILKDDVLNVSVLDPATPGATDVFTFTTTITPKKITLANLEALLWTDFQTYIPTLNDTVTVQAGDKFYILSGGTTAEWCTGTELATYVETAIKTNILDQAFDEAAITSLADADLFSVEFQGTPDVRKTITAANVAAYVSAGIWAPAGGACAAAADVDTILIDDGPGTKKTLTMALLGRYVADTYLWNHADVATVTSLVAGDYLLLGRTGVSDKITWENFTAGIQATVLNISGLGSATLDAADTCLVGEGAVPKIATLTALETKLHADFTTYVNTTLSDAVTTTASDKFYTDVAGTPKWCTALEIATYVAGAIYDTVMGAAFDAAGSAPADADLLLTEVVGVRKTCTATQMATYVSTKMWAPAGGVCAAAVDGDKLLLDNAGSKETITVDVLGAYVIQAHLDDAGALAVVIATDDILIEQGNASKKAPASALKTYVLTGIQASVLNDISGLGVSTLSSADEFIVNESGTATRVTLANLETQLWIDLRTYVVGLTNVDPLADADEFYVNDADAGAGRACTASVLAAYVDDKLWTDAADSTNIVASDHFLVRRASTTVEADISYIQTYIHANFATYSAALASVDESTLTATDKFYLTQAGTPKHVSLENLADYMGGQVGVTPWTAVSDANFTHLPASTSTITFSDTTGMAVGLPLEYTIGTVVKYGIITAVVTNSLVTIAGAPLSATIDDGGLRVGIRSQVVQVDFEIEHAGWGRNASTEILSEYGDKYFRWRRGTAYLVHFSAVQYSVDSGTEAKINVRINGNVVSSADTFLGIQLGAAATWVDNPAIEITTANYDVNYGESVDVYCTAAATTGDAGSLTVSCTFILK